jgi:hypothetical protein
MSELLYLLPLEKYQGAGISIVSSVVKNHIYPIPDQYQNSACKEAIGNQVTENIK